MLKTVLYYLLVLTTVVRFVDLFYLLVSGTNLPGPVLIAATVMVLYGVVIGVKRFLRSVRIKELMVFFGAQSLVIVFNLLYTAANYPLRLSVAETMVLGTFLDLLVNVTVLYVCNKHIRKSFAPVSAE